MNKSKLVIPKDWKGKLIFTDGQLFTDEQLFTDGQPTKFNMMMAAKTKDGR